jgi:hypothetical protein
MPVWLSEEQVREKLPMRELIDLMAATLAGFSSGKVEQPVRSVIEVGHHAFFGSMPAFIKTIPALGTKLVTVVAFTTKSSFLCARRRIVGQAILPAAGFRAGFAICGAEERCSLGQFRGSESTHRRSPARPRSS